jgi:hypothetical protein
MMSLDELQISFPSPNDIISGNFDSEKVDQGPVHMIPLNTSLVPRLFSN